MEILNNWQKTWNTYNHATKSVGSVFVGNKVVKQS